MGFLQIIYLRTCKFFLITFKYNYEKKYHKSLNLKTSSLPDKISRIQGLPEAF